MNKEKKGDRIMDKDAKAIRDLLVTLTEVDCVVVLTAFGPSLSGNDTFYLELVKARYDNERDMSIYEVAEDRVIVWGESVLDALSKLVDEVVEPQPDECEEFVPETDTP